MSEIILDSVIDSIKLLPFLFLTYLFMEWMEHKTGAAARKRIRTAGKFGPVWGGLLGVIPQCGFSAAASSLFAGRVITVGTLIAVYLSTSDEMFPIMISNAVPVVTIVKILTCKAVIGILSGLVLEYVYTHILKKQEPDVDIHEICEEERCHCEHGVISSAAFHTLKVFVLWEYFMDLVYSGELLLNLQELFSDQPSLLCQKKLILGGMIKLWQEAVMRQQAAEKYLNI